MSTAWLNVWFWTGLALSAGAVIGAGLAAHGLRGGELMADRISGAVRRVWKRGIAKAGLSAGRFMMTHRVVRMPRRSLSFLRPARRASATVPALASAAPWGVSPSGEPLTSALYRCEFRAGALGVALLRGGSLKRS